MGISHKTNPDGSNTVNLSNDRGDDHAPVFSPNGDQIAFVSNRANARKEGKYIYIMNADGSGVRQLSHEENSEDPDWSHDGVMITYSNNGDIFKIKVDGSEESIKLTDSPDQDLQPSWSPDGTKIAWLAANQWGRNAYVMDADGGNIFQVGNKNTSYFVEWTPDGRLFTSWSWEDQEEFCQNCIVNVDGTNIVNAGGKDEVINYFPFWTGSGDRGGIFQTDRIAGNNDIFVIGTSLPYTLDIGIGSINLTNNPANDRNPDAPVNCGGGWFVNTDVVAATPQDLNPPGLLIGYAGDDPSQWQRKDSFQKACDELGIQCIYGETPELLNKNVSAIILNSSPEKIQDEASEILNAGGKNVPVFVLDAEIDGAGVYSVMVDRAEMIGATLGLMFKTGTASEDFAFFDFDPSQKDTGIIQGILEKEYPQIKVVTSDTKTYRAMEDKSFVNNLTKDHPNLKAIWTNAGYANVIFGVVDFAGANETLPVMACEPTKTGLFIWRDRIKEHSGFQCVSVGNPPGIAYDAVYAASYLLNGLEIDNSAFSGQYANALIVDFPVITNEDLPKWMDIIQYENDDFMIDQIMTPDEIKDRWFR